MTKRLLEKTRNMQYEKNVTYTLKVTGTQVVNDKHYYLIENEGIKYKVKMLKFQHKLPIPEEVKCIVYGYDADDTPLFAQEKGEIARQLYIVGNMYPFTVHKKITNQSGPRKVYYGFDMNGIRAYIQAGIGKELSIGRITRCIVKHLYPDGRLLVVPVSQDIDKETNFLTYEQLKENIHEEDLPSCIQLNTLRAESAVDSKAQQMLEQYDSRKGEWLLTFLNIILARREEKIETKDWGGVRELIHYQRLITEWILEDSLFLAYYSPELTNSLREKGERELLVCEAIIKAIELIKTNTVEDYLKQIFTKIHTSGYLSDRYRKIELLVALFRLDNTLVDKNIVPLIEFFQYVTLAASDTEAPILTSASELLNKIIEKNIKADNSSPLKIAQLLAASLLLDYNREASTTFIQRIMLYRYAAWTNLKSAKILIEKAYSALTQTNQFYRPEFMWDDIIHFKSDSFIAKLRFFTINEGDDITAQYITKENRILLRKGTFALYLGCNPGLLLPAYQKAAEVLSVFDGRISIYTKKDIKPKLTDSGNIFILKKFWEELYEQLSRPTITFANKTNIKILPTEGTRLKIKLKPFNPRYPLMMFAEVTEPGYVGSGALKASEVTRIHIQSMEELFYEGDSFEATVIKVSDNDRLTFSITNELFEFVMGTVKIGQRVYAKLVHISKESCIWLGEEGYTLFSPDKKNEREIGTVALMEIKDINNMGYINASYIEESDGSIQIEETEALAKLISEYINFSSPQEENGEEEGNFSQAFSDDEAIMTEEQLSIPLIHELSWLLTVTAFSEKSLVTRYNLLGTARLLTNMINDKDLNEYLSLLMNYEENIYSFATHTQPVRWTDFSRIDDAAVSRYPSLESKKELLEILALFHNHTFDPTLAVSIATTKDQNKEHIIRLVLGHALLFQTLPPAQLISLRNELLIRIGAGDFTASEETGNSSNGMTVGIKDAPCLGRESDKMEFKSSIVYPSGRTVPNMKQQSENILRAIVGFLNASGGTLYIGVSDTGFPIGLKGDYTYMVCNSDGYERSIRQHIISTLGKDINSVIKIEFPKYDEVEICCITIPCYGKLVELKGMVWQRQGNSTVLLEGNALVKQQKRKKETLQAEMIQIVDNNLQQVSENLLQTNEAQTAVAAAFAAGLEKKKKKAAAPKKNVIQTSLIRNNEKIKEEGTNTKIAVYLSLLENGGYILENEFSNMENVLITLIVKEEEINGSLLLCYENAFVNRVSLKILLQKKRNYIYKNGANRDSRLIFATIENGEPNILVRTIRQKSEYLKMFPMSKIKTNMDLSLKGTPLFSYEFGKVIAWEVIPAVESDKLQKLYNENLAHQGFQVTSEGLTKERELLHGIGWDIEG